MSAWLWLLGCFESPPPPPKPAVLDFLSVDIRHIGREVAIPELGVRVTFEKMTTSSHRGGGHSAHAIVRLLWEDGTTEVHEGDLGFAFDSHGYEFTIDGMGSSGSVEVVPSIPNVQP